MLLSPVCKIIVRHVAHLKRKCAAPPPPAGDYVISTSQSPTCIQIATVGRPARRLTIVSRGRPLPTSPAKAWLNIKHRNRTSEFFSRNIGTSDIRRFTRIGRSLVHNHMNFVCASSSTAMECLLIRDHNMHDWPMKHWASCLVERITNSLIQMAIRFWYLVDTHSEQNPVIGIQPVKLVSPKLAQCLFACFSVKHVYVGMTIYWNEATTNNNELFILGL